MERKQQWRIYENGGHIHVRPRGHNRQRGRRHNWIILTPYSALIKNTSNKADSAFSAPRELCLRMTAWGCLYSSGSQSSYLGALLSSNDAA